MKLSEFDFELPEELIAQHPVEKRDTSRLMVVNRENGNIEHRHFYDILDYLKPGDVLVRNNTKVIPARLFGIKEETNGHVEVLLLKELKKDTYTSLEALNAAVKKIVADINQRPFQKKSDIRKSRMNGFEKYDKPRMNQLPGESYTLCDYKYFLKVPDNYHLEYDAHYYSVLYTYKGKPAILKATMTEIRICDEYNRLICRHPRSYRDFPLYITDDNHMPPEHLYYKEVNAHDGAYYRRWASVYGESMVTLIDRILRSSKHEEQAYNSCAGVFHSCKDVPHRLVQEAAEKCVEANACKYSYFKKVLSMVQNNHSSSAINGTGKLPSHTNIRGKEAYK